MIAGTVGSFGGMSIAAGLCTRLIVTPQARIGLNGPAVIEQEAGIEEFDSADHALIWAVNGGEQRHATGLADSLVPDDADRIRAAVTDGLSPRRVGGRATTAANDSTSASRPADLAAARPAAERAPNQQPHPRLPSVGRGCLG